MEDGSKTQSLKNSLSLANAHQFKQSCGYSRSLSSFGDSFTSGGLNDTFGAGFSDKLGGLAGKVTKIGIATEMKKSPSSRAKKYKYVEITGKDGLVVRQLYVKPSVKVGDTVKAGETSIGTVENLAPKYGKKMPNHTHVEVYDTNTVMDNGRTDIKRFKRIDLGSLLGLGKK